MKACRTCKVEKDESEFTFRTGGKHLRSDCKICQKLAWAAWSKVKHDPKVKMAELKRLADLGRQYEASQK